MKKKMEGTKRRMLALVLALAMMVCGMPLYSGSVTAQAAETSAWDSWEDLYNVMVAEAEEDGFTHGAEWLSNAVYYGGDEFWETIIEVMDSLDIAGEETDYEKVYTIANWIGANVTYSTTSERCGNAAGALLDGQAKCSGYAALFCIMCEYVGIKTTYVGCAQTNHAWNAVKVDGNWYWADITNFSSVEEEMSTFLYGNDGYCALFQYDVLQRAIMTNSAVCELISDYGYYYYNTECNGEHTWKKDSWRDAGMGGYTSDGSVREMACRAGFVTYKCTKCGCYHTEKIESDTAHVYEVAVVDPTCTSDGYTYYVCSTCGEYYIENYYTYKFDTTEALGHDETDTDDLIITKEPTCTAKGYGYTYCTRCGQKITRVTLAAAGHSWDGGVVTTEATALTDGVMTYTCTNDGCGETYTEAIPATGGSLLDAVITLEYNSCMYDGKHHYPEVTVTIDGMEAENTIKSTVTSGNTMTYTGTMYTIAYKTGSSYYKTGEIPVTISAGTNGLLTDEVTVYFTIEKADTTVTASIDSDIIEAGSTAQITASAAVTTTGTSRTVYYESSDESVATVNSSGLVTGVSSGVAVITVYTAYNASYYNQGYAYITVTVTEADKTDISGATVTLGTSSYTYDGTAKTPSVTVIYNGTALVSGTDYMVSYADNVNAGTATVTVAGCGSYTGSVTKTFTVSAADLSGADAALSKTSYTYDGSAKEPSVTVTLDGTTLVSGTDYTVAYSGNTNAGTATVTVTGTGNYTGTATATFKIAKAAQVITLSASSTTLTAGDTLSLSASVSTGNTITYASSDTSVATVSSSGVVTGISAGTVTVTASVAGTTNYSAASASITLTVKAAVVDLSGAEITLGKTSYTYDGTAKKPSVTVTLDGTTLVSGTDYTVVYSDNTNAGTATVTVTGTGSYTGTASAAFTIAKAAQVVTLSASATTLAVGSTLSLTGSVSTGNAITYTSSDTSVAAVSSSGVVTGISAGTVTITASVAGTANYSAGSAAVTLTVNPAAVSITAISNTSSGVKLTWDKAAGASGYYIYRSTASGSGYSKIGTVTSGSTVNYTDSTAASGTAYYYKVRSYSGSYTGAYSGYVSIVRLSSAKISSVSNITAGIKVTWGKVTGASGYYVYRKESGGSYSKVKTITSGSTVSYKDTAVKSKSGTTYTYKIIPYYKDSAGTVTKGTNANTKTIIRLSSATVSSLTNTSSGITVKWGKVTGANGYYVYRKTSGGSYSKVKTITSGSTVSYTDTVVKSKNGTTYIYKVLPYYKNSSGAVTKGSYANTKTTVRLTAVSISSVKNSSSKKMTVKWAKNSKVTGYQIQYSTSSSFASGNKTVTVTSASTVSKVISSLTKGKTYYVRVRTYKTVSGTKYYSAWSSKKSVKISK